MNALRLDHHPTRAAKSLPADRGPKSPPAYYSVRSAVISLASALRSWCVAVRALSPSWALTPRQGRMQPLGRGGGTSLGDREHNVWKCRLRNHCREAKASPARDHTAGKQVSSTDLKDPSKQRFQDRNMMLWISSWIIHCVLLRAAVCGRLNACGMWFPRDGQRAKIRARTFETRRPHRGNQKDWQAKSSADGGDPDLKPASLVALQRPAARTRVAGTD